MTLLVVFSIAMGLSACNGGANENQESTNQNTEEDAKKMKGLMPVDLNNYGIPILAYVPDSTAGNLEVEELPTGELLLKVGEMFQIQIAEGGNLAEKKTFLSEDLVYRPDFIKSEDNLLMYSKTIEGSGMKPEFHFYQLKNIGGVTYEIQSYQETATPFIEGAIERMLEITSLFKPQATS